MKSYYAEKCHIHTFNYSIKQHENWIINEEFLVDVSQGTLIKCHRMLYTWGYTMPSKPLVFKNPPDGPKNMPPEKSRNLAFYVP